MKIYRIWSRNWTGKIEECAFVSSLESVCNYIKAQLPKEAKISGSPSQSREWLYNLEKDNNKFMYAVEKGYHIGETFQGYLQECYWVDVITVEN